MSETELLKRLARVFDWRGRRDAARDPDATERLLLAALEDEDPDVRMAAARNPRASEVVLMEAMKNKDCYVRRAARNPRATERVLRIAALDPDEEVLKAARENFNASTRTRIIGVL